MAITFKQDDTQSCVKVWKRIIDDPKPKQWKERQRPELLVVTVEVVRKSVHQVDGNTSTRGVAGWPGGNLLHVHPMYHVEKYFCSCYLTKLVTRRSKHKTTYPRAINSAFAWVNKKDHTSASSSFSSVGLCKFPH